MNNNEFYKNGQRIKEQDGDILTYYFKSGEIKAMGKSINDSMEGKWIFNKGAGFLWGIGNFLNNQKHGEWIRYNENGEVVYHAEFIEGKISKKIK